MTPRYDVLVSQYLLRDQTLLTLFVAVLALVVAWLIVDRGFIKSRFRAFLRALIPGSILVLIILTLVYSLRG